MPASTEALSRATARAPQWGCRALGPTKQRYFPDAHPILYGSRAGGEAQAELATPQPVTLHWAPGSPAPLQSHGTPGSGVLSGTPGQPVHMASWNGEPGTVRARPRAVQLRWGWHCSALELLAEKVPRGQGWHCVFWVGVPGGDIGTWGQRELGCPYWWRKSRHHPQSTHHPPRATTP